MQPQIPLEILDYIFSFLRDDHASLRSCAEVNTIFSDTVERHLYHRLKLVNLQESAEINEITPATFMKLLTPTPRLTSHVKMLDIRFPPIAALRYEGEGYTNTRLIGEILRLLSRVLEINLYGIEMSWSELHPVFREAFSQIIVQPSVEEISISGTSDFPLPLIDHCSSLKSLFLNKLESPISNMSESGLSTECPSLSPNHKRPKPICLDLYILLSPWNSSLQSILTWLRSPQSPRLFVLTTDVRNLQDVEDLQDVMDYCASELEEVHLLSDEISQMSYGFNLRQLLLRRVRPDFAPHPMQAPDFSRMRVLEAISLGGSIESMNPNSPSEKRRLDPPISHSCIPWFVQVLESFGRSDTPNRLEDVNLNITFAVDEVSLTTQVDWEPLVTVLRSKYFSSLRVVRLTCSCVSSETWSLDIPPLKSALSQDVHLASLIRCGLLSIRGPFT